jgi:hypothetical protein
MLVLIFHSVHPSSEHVTISHGGSLGDVVEVKGALVLFLVKDVFLCSSLFTDVVDEHIDNLDDFLEFFFTFISQRNRDAELINACV